ncbi:hypothetical protein AA958_16620 [Streptomyces sp. CNQ-509]|nr:hypothetical protein AA958_16620 [Streptomyces sp. CNQ-509]
MLGGGEHPGDRCSHRLPGCPGRPHPLARGAAPEGDPEAVDALSGQCSGATAGTADRAGSGAGTGAGGSASSCPRRTAAGYPLRLAV